MIARRRTGPRWGYHRNTVYWQRRGRPLKRVADLPAPRRCRRGAARATFEYFDVRLECRVVRVVARATGAGTESWREGRARRVAGRTRGGAAMTGYADAAPVYFDPGWSAPLPLPCGAKKPVPTGFTGRERHRTAARHHRTVAPREPQTATSPCSAPTARRHGPVAFPAVGAPSTVGHAPRLCLARFRGGVRLCGRRGLVWVRWRETVRGRVPRWRSAWGFAGRWRAGRSRRRRRAGRGRCACRGFRASCAAEVLGLQCVLDGVAAGLCGRCLSARRRLLRAGRCSRPCGRRVCQPSGTIESGFHVVGDGVRDGITRSEAGTLSVGPPGS